MRWLSLLCVALLVGCSASDESRPAASQSVAAASAEASSSGDSGADVRDVHVAELGFSMSLPGTWVVFSPADLGGAAFDDARDEYPNESDLIDDAEAGLEDGRYELLAFEPDSGAAELGFVANLNVVAVADGANADPEQVATDIAASVEDEIPVKGEIQAGTARVPAGEIAVVAYVWPLESQEGTIDAGVTQFAFPMEDAGFIITLAAPDELIKEYIHTWDEIVDSVALH
jgi:hypothetical protein